MHLLLLEDDKEDAYLLDRQLRRAPNFQYELKVCATYEMAHADIAACDLVLLDLHLPDKSGLDLVEALRRDFPDVPIIIVTGQDDSGLARDAVRVGVQDVLVKADLSSAHLGKVISFALERHKLMLELRHVNQRLQESLAHIDTLHGLLPICASCKRIRNDENYWEEVETYVCRHSDASFTHGLCPVCYESSLRELNLYDRDRAEKLARTGNDNA